MNLPDLGHRLADPRRGGIDGPLAAAIATLLIEEQPTTPEAIGARLAEEPTAVTERLAAIPETEYDASGNVIGHILSRNETPTSIRFCTVQLYAWCPLDTLILPGLLGRTAYVRSRCGVTGSPVSLSCSPTHALCAEAPDLHLSVPIPNDITRLRSAFCEKVRFLESAAAATTWHAQHPDCHVMRLDKAFTFARQITDELTRSANDRALSRSAG